MSARAQVNERATPLRPAAARGSNEELRFVEHAVSDVRVQRVIEVLLTEALDVLVLAILDHGGREHAASTHVPMAGSLGLRSTPGRLLGRGISRLADGGTRPLLGPPWALAHRRYDTRVAGCEASNACCGALCCGGGPLLHRHRHHLVVAGASIPHAVEVRRLSLLAQVSSRMVSQALVKLVF